MLLLKYSEPQQLCIFLWKYRKTHHNRWHKVHSDDEQFCIIRHRLSVKIFVGNDTTMAAYDRLLNMSYDILKLEEMWHMHWGYLTLPVLKLEYFWWTMSIPCLLMPWFLASPGHQQPWYWICVINESLPSTRKYFSELHHINIEILWKIQIYTYFFSQKFLASQELTLLFRVCILLSKHFS